jgi:hypothetical protein
VLLATAGALRADPPGVLERIEKGGGSVHRDDPGGRVYGVRLPPRATDADLLGLCELRQLRGLNLNRSGVTDEGPRALEAMPGLRTLDLTDCPNVTDGGVARLRKALPGWEVYR